MREVRELEGQRRGGVPWLAVQGGQPGEDSCFSCTACCLGPIPASRVLFDHLRSCVSTEMLTSSPAGPLQTFCSCWTPFWFPTFVFAISALACHPLASPWAQILPVPSWPLWEFQLLQEALSGPFCNLCLCSELQFS